MKDADLQTRIRNISKPGRVSGGRQMYFTLVMTESGKSLHVVATCREEALFLFGKELAAELTDKATGRVSSMLLDEFFESPHWAYPHIPIWEKPKAEIKITRY